MVIYQNCEKANRDLEQSCTYWSWSRHTCGKIALVKLAGGGGCVGGEDKVEEGSNSRVA
jgi:hypothetical protein